MCVRHERIKPQVYYEINLELVVLNSQSTDDLKMTKLGTTIRSRLSELGKTQGWLADEVGVSNNAVTKWIATGKISRANSVATAKALDLSLEALLGEAEHKDASDDTESADALLSKVAEMIETYRLADPADRDRIDYAFGEARKNLAGSDQSKPRTR